MAEVKRSLAWIARKHDVGAHQNTATNRRPANSMSFTNEDSSSIINLGEHGNYAGILPKTEGEHRSLLSEGVNKFLATARGDDYIFLRWPKIFVDSQYGTFFMASFWSLEL
jgi:hypothetical protein